MRWAILLRHCAAHWEPERSLCAGAGEPTRIGSIVVDPDVDDGRRFVNTDKALKLCNGGGRRHSVPVPCWEYGRDISAAALRGNRGQPLARYDVSGSRIVQEHVRGRCLQAAAVHAVGLVASPIRELCLRDGACEHVIVIGSAPSAGYHWLSSKDTFSPNDGRLR